MDDQKTQLTTEPIYRQFKKIGKMFGDQILDKYFLKRARRFYADQYFAEMRYLRKEAKRAAKWSYTDKKRADKKARRNTKRAARRAAMQAWRAGIAAWWRAWWYALLVRLHIRKANETEKTPEDMTDEKIRQAAKVIATKMQEDMTDEKIQQAAKVIATKKQKVIKWPKGAPSFVLTWLNSYAETGTFPHSVTDEADMLLPLALHDDADKPEPEEAATPAETAPEATSATKAPQQTEGQTAADEADAGTQAPDSDAATDVEAETAADRPDDESAEEDAIEMRGDTDVELPDL